MSARLQPDGSPNLGDLISFLDASPSPYHAVATASRQLVAAGFEELASDSVWDDIPPAGFVIRDASMIAWRVGANAVAGAPLRLVGAHTDSPNLRISACPDMARFNWNQLHVEPYGGVLYNSWLDRDLGIAGRVVTRDGRSVLIDERRPLARVPQLAIHLDRGVNDGLMLNPQDHLQPVWAIDGNAPRFGDWLAATADIEDPVSWELGLYDIQPAAIAGVDGSMLASGRLDNQVSCWAAVDSLIGAEPTSSVAVIVLNDHEEVGSVSATGADGPWLGQVLERISAARGASRAEHLSALAASFMVSADNAHAIHPNYPERSEPRHAPRINHGPAIKWNAKQRYATTAESSSRFIAACDAVGVEYQYFASNNAIPCGTTIGPISAAQLGVDVIDVGVPQLAMHSAREVCGSEDPVSLARVLRHLLSA